MRVRDDRRGTGCEGENLHEDRGRGDHRAAREPAGPQGRHPHRGVRHGRRAERGARAWPAPRGWTRPPTRLTARLQNELFAVGSALADPDPKGKYHHAIQGEHATRLEGGIDALESELPPFTNFILPGGRSPAAQLHLARTVCRRAERLVVRLARQPGSDVPTALIVYLNRLSDLLFVMARVVNHRARVSDIPWKGL